MAVHDEARIPSIGLRLRDVRLREEVSLRSMAKRLRRPVSEVRAQESGESEVTLSDLYRWQQALKVPMVDLFADPEAGLVESIRKRAGLVRVAKTAHFLVKKCRPGTEQQQARQIVRELCELMPELREVSAWPERRPRPMADYGRAAEEISTRDWLLSPE